MKVFIVDDSRAFREELINLLSKLKGVEIVGQAKDSVEAMEAIQRLKPDAVILGIPISGGNGIRLVKNIKKDKLAPIVIILIPIANIGKSIWMLVRISFLINPPNLKRSSKFLKSLRIPEGGI
jgi:two-component system chemotaxis response regulator CheB